MGSKPQAASELPFSAADAAGGFGAPGSFPYAVLGNESPAPPIRGGLKMPSRRASAPAAPAGGAERNPAFEAYVRRPASAGRTARQALVQALAEAGGEADGVGPAAGESLSHQGVAGAPVAMPDVPVAAATPKTAAPIRLARKPRIRVESPADNETAALSAPELLVPLPTLAPFVPGLEEPAAASAPAPVSTSATEPVPGRLKVALRRPGAASAPPLPPLVPLAPPTEAPFLMGPVMDGTRAPLVPIPSVGPGMPPLPMPLPAGGDGQASGFLVPLAMPGPAVETKDEGKAASVPKTKKNTERGVWWGRAVAAAVGLAFLVLGTYEWQQRGLWPFHPEAADTAVAASLAPVKPFWTVEVTGGQAVPTSVSVVDAERPAPARDFVQMVERFKITGVLQTKPARAIVDGKIVEAGEMVDFARGIRLVGLDQEKHLVIFEDQTSARAAVRY